MASVPLQLKYLRKHFAALKTLHETFPESPERVSCFPSSLLSILLLTVHVLLPFKLVLADVISMLATTFKEGDRDCLKYKLVGNTYQIDIWGHEYVRSVSLSSSCCRMGIIFILSRHLAGEIGKEAEARAAALPEGEAPTGLGQDLLKLVQVIVPFDLKHNSEPEACDLLLEVNHNWFFFCVFSCSCNISGGATRPDRPSL